jgi:prolyl oligopeptidase
MTGSRLGFAAALLALASTPVLARAQAADSCTLPRARTVDTVTNYFGTTVADPYRWLEDTDSPETKAWVDSENCVTFHYLAAVPERSRIAGRLTKLWNYERFGVPSREGGKYIYSRNDGLQNQSVVYWLPRLDASPRVLIDPNTLSRDGTVALSTWDVSHDGRYFGYGTAAAGSDWNEFHVRSFATGHDLSDHLKWIKFSGLSWTHDNRGFFYSRYPEPTGNALRAVVKDQKLYYHRLGTPQASDQLVYERPDHPDWGLGGGVTEDGRYLIIYVSLGTDSRNRVYYMDLGGAAHPRIHGTVVRLLDDFDATYDFVGNLGPVFYFRTNLDAPRAKLIAIDTRHHERSAWRLIVPQGPDVLDGVALIGGRFVTNYMHDAHSLLAVYDTAGAKVADVALPTLGSVGGISGRADSPEMFYDFTSFLYPTTIFRYDVRTGQDAVWKAPHLDFDASQYETQQVFYASKDGTRVPMFLTYRKGTQRDGSNPVYLTAYGGFDISTLPSFSVVNAVWLEMGGVLAEPNLRGGGEYGEEWHQAGMHEKKQNVFDDFIAAAEYLIRERWTSTPRLAVGGASNGGLLIGAVEDQRPDLFGATLPAVGVMDMLRFQKFTIGWAWVTEYGSSDSASQFPYLYKYSPLQSIRPGVHYPPTLVTTADHDDRVVPGHSFKYAATLQADQGGTAPVLIRIETRAGHGGGMPVSKQIELSADRWAFLLKNLGMTLPPQLDR